MAETTPAPEEWRSVASFEGSYEVSDQGGVRSLDRVIIATRQGRPLRWRLRGRVLKPTLGAYYFMVTLGRDNHRYVHALVAEAFLGPRPAGMEVCHGRGGQQDNRVANLSYGTHAQNNGPDKARDGTLGSGEQGPNAKLTWEQVDEIRRRMPKGTPRGERPAHLRHIPTQKQIGAEYGVTHSVISTILAEKTWRPEFRDRGS